MLEGQKAAEEKFAEIQADENQSQKATSPEELLKPISQIGKLEEINLNTFKNRADPFRPVAHLGKKNFVWNYNKIIYNLSG